MSKVKTEYGRGILKGIDLIQEAFVGFTIQNPDKINGTMNVSEIIGFLTTFRAGVEQVIEKAEAEAEVKAE